MGRTKKTANQMRALRARIRNVIGELAKGDPERLESWLARGERRVREFSQVRVK